MNWATWMWSSNTLKSRPIANARKICSGPSSTSYLCPLVIINRNRFPCASSFICSLRLPFGFDHYAFCFFPELPVLYGSLLHFPIHRKEKLFRYSGHCTAQPRLQFYCTANKVKIIFFLQSYFLIVCCSYVSNNCFNGAFTILQSIFKKEFPELVKSSSYFWIIVLNIIVYPVLLRRKNSEFKVYFLISFFAGIIIIFFISSQYLDDIVNEVKTETQDYVPFKPDGMFSSICLIVFACMCHNDVLEMYHEMKYKNSARFKSVNSKF